MEVELLGLLSITGFILSLKDGGFRVREGNPGALYKCHQIED